MKLRYLILAAALLPGALYAQAPKADDAATIEALKEQVSHLTIENANLRMALLQQQASQVTQDKLKAIQDIQAAHPGMRWDDAQGKLVPLPPNPAEKKPEPAKK